MKKFGVKSVVASAILAALVFVLLRFVAIPTPFPDTTLSIYAAVISFFSVLFGPIVGFLGGFTGNMLVDLTAGWGVWWSWVFATGLYGLLMGLATKKIDLEDGIFGKKEFIRFAIAVVINCLICWGIVAPVGDVLIYAEPFNLVFVQCLFIGISGMVSSLVIGGLLCKAYAASRAQKGSLTKED